MEIGLTGQIMLWAFGIAVIMGAVVNKTNFCTMGAVSDWVNMGDTGRFRSWVFAIATAILGVMLLELFGVTDMSLTASPETGQPPYRAPLFVWPRYLLGGFLFGIGMTLGSGCGNKTMIRVGAGNIKSLVVLLVMGAGAYLMIYTSFDHYTFLQWMNPVAINFADMGVASQDLGAVVAGLLGLEGAQGSYYNMAILLAAVFLFWSFRGSEFRGSFDNILGGGVVGVAIVALWAVTAGPLGQEWLSEIEWMDVPPHASGVQSYTFVAPSGQLVNYLSSSAATNLFTVAMAGALGVIVGSFLWSIIARSFRVEWFVDFADLARHVIGGALMGIGGVLGLGCTVGQGITGFSTLAIGSMLTFISIAFGAALTMKIQYYKLVYEEEATFGKTLITALVDLRLLPASLRKLDAI